MKKTKFSKLELRTTTIGRLSQQDLQRVAGGWLRPPITWSCPQPSQYGSCGCPQDDH